MVEKDPFEIEVGVAPLTSLDVRAHLLRPVFAQFTIEVFVESAQSVLAPHTAIRVRAQDRYPISRA